jgi:hypothetical protein
MNDNILRVQVTIQQMKRLLKALEGLSEEMTKNPKLYALMAEGPIDLIGRMCTELDELLEPLKHGSEVSAPTAAIVDNSISAPAAPGPIESTS